MDWASHRAMRSSCPLLLLFSHASSLSHSLLSVTGRGSVLLLLYFQHVSPSLDSAWYVCSFTTLAPFSSHRLPLQTAFHTNTAVRYAGVFLGGAGTTANTPAIVSYMQNNIAGQSKRAFVTATASGAGAIGGIITSTAFRTEDAPGYRPGCK